VKIVKSEMYKPIVFLRRVIDFTMVPIL